MSERDAFAAIADPTRRQILDQLYDNGPLNAGEIARCFADASRPGISRHLRVLRECGVVIAEKAGKQRLYDINVKPLNDLRVGWLAKFGDMQRDSLIALREVVERGEQ